MAAKPDVARAVLLYRRLDRLQPDRWQVNTLFFAVDCRPPLRLHPWLRTQGGRAPGARAHVAMLLRAHAVVAALDRTRRHDMIFPLLAQPVLEEYLAIASSGVPPKRNASGIRTSCRSRLT